jgi:hypothetical protein
MKILALVSAWVLVVIFVPLFLHGSKASERAMKNAERASAEAEYAEFLRRKG